jgi:hypothetical protein
MTPPRHSAPCPHPDCTATLAVPDTLAGGDYPCLCHACTVHLLWATSLNGGRTPMLSLAPGAGERIETDG